MNNPIKLAHVNDVPEGKAVIVRIPDGEEIALFKVKGHIYAINNACPHMGAPLGEGRLQGDIVTCPLHAWEFNVKTGECINIPGEDVACYSLDIRDGEIFLNQPP